MNYLPRSGNLITSIVFSAFILTGCGEESSTEQPTKTEIKYLSHIDQAQFYQKQGQLKESILEARNALNLQNNQIQPFMIVGENLLIAGDGRSAEKQFRALLESKSSQLENNSHIKQEVDLLLVEALFLQGKQTEALTLLDNSSITTSNLKVKKSLLHGDILLSQNNPALAENAYNKSLTLDSSSIEALIGLSKVAIAQQQPEVANKYISEAEAISSSNPQLWLWKAQLAQFEKRWVDSEEAYIRALEDIGSYDIMTYEKYQTISDLVIVLREQGKASEAFVYEEVLAKSSPGTIKSTYMSAVKHFQNGNFKKAQADLESIINQSPGHIESGILLGITQYYLGDFKAAEKTLSTYLEEVDSLEATKVLAATKLKLRQPKEAKDILANMAKPDNDPQLLSLFGIASLASGDQDTGLEYINKSLSLQPDNPKLRLKLANYYLQTGNTKGAEAQLKAIAPSSELIHQANLQLTAVYTKSNQPEKAASLISKWKSKFPNNAEPWIAEAGIASYNKQLDKAEILLKQAVKIAPSNISSLVSLAKIQSGQKKIESALSTLETAIVVQPTNITVLKDYLTLSAISNNNQRALSFTAKLAETQSKVTSLHLAVAELEARQGNIAKGIEITKNLSKEAEDKNQYQGAIEAIYTIGVQTALESNDPKSALDIAEDAYRNLPESLKAGLLLTGVQFKLDKKTEAENTLRKLKITHSESEIPYEFEGDHYARNNDFSRAADAYRLASAKVNSDKLKLKIYNSLKASGNQVESDLFLNNWIAEYPDNPRALLLLALKYQAKNQKEKAITTYEKLTKITPNDAVTLNNLAWLYFETNNKSAEETAKKAYTLNANSAAIADTYGWILFKNGKIKESTVILEQAYQLAPGSQEIAMHLAEIYEAQGNKEKSNKIKSSFN